MNSFRSAIKYLARNPSPDFFAEVLSIRSFRDGGALEMTTMEQPVPAWGWRDMHFDNVSLIQEIRVLVYSQNRKQDGSEPVNKTGFFLSDILGRS